MKRVVLVFAILVIFLGIATLVWHAADQERRNVQNPLLAAYNEMALGTEKAGAVVIVQQRLADDPIVLFGKDIEIWSWLWIGKKLPEETLAETAALDLYFSKDKLVKATYRHNRDNALKTKILE